MDIFFWPIMDLLVLGFLGLYLSTFNTGKIDILAMLVGGVILWQIVDRTQHSVSIYFLEDVWERNFLNLFVTPLKISEFFLGGIIFSLIKVIFTAFIMFIIALFFYHFSLLSFGIYLIPDFINLFLFGVVIAIFINSIILRFGSSAQVLAFGISILIQPLSAVYYPVSLLPLPFQYISHLLPSTYIFEFIRKIGAGGSFELSSFFIPLGLNILYLFLMSFFFMAMFKKVKVQN